MHVPAAEALISCRPQPLQGVMHVPAAKALQSCRPPSAHKVMHVSQPMHCPLNTTPAVTALHLVTHMHTCPPCLSTLPPGVTQLCTYPTNTKGSMQPVQCCSRTQDCRSPRLPAEARLPGQTHSIYSLHTPCLPANHRAKLATTPGQTRMPCSVT